MSNEIQEIGKIIFGIYSPEEIKKMAVVEINSTKLSGIGSVYDERMGGIDNIKTCVTCDMDTKSCPGHFGYINLNEHIIHPLYYKMVVNFLRCFCIKCYNILIIKEQLELWDFTKYKRDKRFNRILEKIEKVDICCHCFYHQPKISHNIQDNNIIMIYKEKNKQKTMVNITVEEIERIFDNILDTDMELLGFDTSLIHPKNLILSVFPVLPPIARPFVMADGNICDDDLTNQIIEIIKANNHLLYEEGVPIREDKKQKYLQSLKFRISTFYNNSNGRAKHSTNGRSIKGLKERITGKEGLIRNNLLGKRCVKYDTPVLLWNGKIKRADEIIIGDIIIGDDGNKRTVQDVCSGEDNMYTIKQNKGDDYVVNSEHTLTLKYCSHKTVSYRKSSKRHIIKWFDINTFREKSKKFQNIEELEIFSKTINDCDVFDIPVKDYLTLPSESKRCLMGFKLSTSIKWDYKQVSLDPYILGMWLGDGNSRGRGFTSNDKELVDYWKLWASQNNSEITPTVNNGTGIHYGVKGTRNGKNILKTLLKEYNLVDNKHVPEDYIYNDKNTRLSILAGIIDTDGSVESCGKMIVITQWKEHSRIIDGINLISKSLGFRTSIYDRKVSCVHKGEKKNSIALILTISGSGVEEIPTLLLRKKCYTSEIRDANSYKIEVIPYGVDKYNGFELDGNNRFLLGDYTVTHNCEFSGRTVIGPDPTLKLGQLAIPVEIANNMTIPERVTVFNIKWLTELVNNEKANFLLKNGGKTRINLKYALFKKGTELLYGDIIHRDNKKIKVLNNNGLNIFSIKNGDKIERNGSLLPNIQYTTKKNQVLDIGDIVERQLKDGDIVLLNRQPTLHIGSMLAQEVVIKPFKTFRFNLAITKSFNADFDGDEMNIHVPQSLESQAELRGLSMAKDHLISAQGSKPIIGIFQDSLVGAYIMSKGFQYMRKDQFFDIAMKVDFPRRPGTKLTDVEKMSSGYIIKRIKNINIILRKFGKKAGFSGKGLVSLILPDTFNYERKNNIDSNEPIVKIYKGVFYEGVLDKTILGQTHNSIVQLLMKEYGEDTASCFVDNMQFITNNWLLNNGFGIGLEDCLIKNNEQQIKIQDVISKCLLEAEGIKDSTHHVGIREIRINGSLSKARDIGLKISKDSLSSDNNFLATVNSGSKGDFFNIAQITGLLGQQNLVGKRVQQTLNNGRRTLPHYHFGKLSIENEYESRGFIKHSFIHGLNPQEFFFHAMSGREGVCDTAMGTSKSGYIQRKIVKVCEDIKVSYDGTIRDTTGKIYQTSYGENGYDACQLVKVGNTFDCCDVSRIVDRLNMEYE